MKKLFYIFLFFLTLNFVFGQTFQGRIIYSVTYQNKTTHKYDTSLMLGLGSVETCYIKNGNYLIKGNGNKKEWILYKSATNKIYEKYKNNDTIFVIDASVNNNTIKEKYRYKNTAKWTYKNSETGKAEVLKYNEYVFITDQGTEYFYYHKKYKIDPTLFADHKYGHFSDFVLLSGCIPLDINKDLGPYNCSWSAEDFFFEKLEDTVFKIPYHLI